MDGIEAVGIYLGLFECERHAVLGVVRPQGLQRGGGGGGGGARVPRRRRRRSQAVERLCEERVVRVQRPPSGASRAAPRRRPVKQNSLAAQNWSSRIPMLQLAEKITQAGHFLE